MILYRMAKWMEERSKLHRSIVQSEGDTSLLEIKKERVEEQLIAEANRLMAGPDGISIEVLPEFLVEGTSPELVYVND